jgi:glycosyltransferase involved in cell wall biosynthesis
MLFDSTAYFLFLARSSDRRVVQRASTPCAHALLARSQFFLPRKASWWCFHSSMPNCRKLHLWMARTSTPKALLYLPSGWGTTLLQSFLHDSCECIKDFGARASTAPSARRLARPASRRHIEKPLSMPSRRSLRVALISHTFGEYCVQLANGLAQHAQVLLLLPTHVAAPHVAHLNDGVRLFRFQNPRFRQPILQFRMLRTLFQTIRDFTPDVIHYQGGHPWLDLALPCLRRYPLVLTIHDFKPHPGDRLSKKTPLWMETFARHQADELIVHTRFVRDQVIGECPASAEGISVIPHIQIGRDSLSTSIRDDGRVILFFGRIWPYKGLEYLIRAEPLITAHIPEAKILIAGQGENFSHYSQMMMHPDRFIVDNEFIPDERAADYFARASVVVLPYIEASQSGVVSLAYSAAKPVVATTVGGLPEMIEHGRTGYLIPPRDAAQLAEAVTRLLLDADLRHQMGINGRRKVEAECSPGVVARKTMEVYRRTIERTARNRVCVLDLSL